MVIGNKEVFAFVIGQKENATMQIVDIWIENELITKFDNTVYLPQFVNSLTLEVGTLEKNKVQDDYIFLNYGPTTDDVSSRIKFTNDDIHIDVNFNDGKQVRSKIMRTDLIEIYKKTIDVLKEE
jgi:hypothetical protein